MIDRHKRTARRKPAATFLESLEERTLFSTAYAVMVMDAPFLPNQPVQVDQSVTPSPASGSATLESGLDLRVRIVAGGIYLTVAASALNGGALTPTGTIDFQDQNQFLGTVALGGSMRNFIPLAPGEHIFLVSYNGDTNFLPSQDSEDINIPAPAPLAPASSALAHQFATNTVGERVRPMRLLSLQNFFDAAGMSVGAIPSIGGGSVPAAAGSTPLPNPRFSRVTFSLNVPHASAAVLKTFGVTSPVFSSAVRAMNFMRL